MNADPAFALSKEVHAKSVLIEQLRDLAANDADFFIDLVEGQTNLTELLQIVDASIIEDELIIEGVKVAAERLLNRRKAAEMRIETKRRLLAHTLHQVGLKKVRLPTATLSIVEAGIKAIPITPEDIPSCWWRPQPPKLDQDGLTKAVRAREKALKAAEAIIDAAERAEVLAQIDRLHPTIPGVEPSEPGITLMRRV